MSLEHITENEKKAMEELYVGHKVRCNLMKDESNPVPPGTTGVIVGVDDIGQLLVDWDNNSTLSLVPQLDDFTILDGPGKEDVIEGAMEVDGVPVTIDPSLENVTVDEVRAYLQFVKNAAAEKISFKSFSIKADTNGTVAIDYVLKPVKFERIRRITGYLVGTEERWNQAKRAELHDRVKHSIKSKKNGFSR